MTTLTRAWRVVATMALVLTFLVFRARPALAAPASTAPANDAFASATVISSTPFTTSEATTAATMASDDPTSCGPPDNSVWFAITPSVDEVVDANASGTTYFNAVSVYTGVEGSLSSVGCDESFPGSVEWAATAGVTYHIMVSDPFGPGGGSLTLTVDAFLPPANDDFNSATVISSTPFTTSENTSGATAASDDPTGCGTPANTVWFAITTSVNETVVVNTTSSAYSTAVSAYSGAPGSLNQVACDENEQFSPAAWAATAGVTYHIMVSSAFGSEGGNLVLTVDTFLPPANDDFNSATVISSTPFTTTENTTGATAAADDPTGCGMPANTVWFAITLSVNETVVVTTNGSTYATVVSAYSGVRDALNQVACANVQDSQSPTAWAATAGVTYHIMVGSAFESGGGTLELTVNTFRPPANDDFNNATVISSTPFTTTEDTTGATAAADDPTGCGGAANSVWFAITPSVNESLVANASNSAYFPAVSVYTGNRGALNQVACSNEPFSSGAVWVASAGVTYDIMVSSSSNFGQGVAGSLSLSVTAYLPPANDDFVNATVISATPFTATEDITGATAAADDPTSCGGAANSVWYSLTPAVNETVFLSTSNGVQASAYSGSEGSLTQVACGATSPFGGPSWVATAGVTYHIMVAASAPNFTGTVTLQVSVAVAPANDDFNNATVITSLPYTTTENVAGATTAADDPTGCGSTANTVWFSITPNLAETIDISSGSFFAPISVYTGPRGGLTQIACGFIGTEGAQFVATAGVTYHIMVANSFPFEGNDDQLSLNITGTVPPANDDFDHATVVTSLPFTDSVDAEAATTAADDPTGCSGAANSVWYQVTPSVGETIVANTAGSAYQASVSVYTGKEGALTQVACGQPSVTFSARKGVTYFIMVVDAEPFFPAGQLDFNLQGFLPPPNDAIGHATVIGALPYASSEVTTGATTVSTDPTCEGQPPEATVWYRVTSPASGTIQVSTAGSTYNDEVSVYTGSPGDLTQIACGFAGTGPVQVTRGDTYYFEVSAYPFGPVGGTLQFAVTGLSDGPGACTSSATGSLAGGMTVSSGTACISNATVNGPVTVNAGAELVLTNTTVRGTVTSDGAAELQICGSSTGSLLVTNSKGLVVIGNGGANGCAANTIKGNILLGGSSSTGNASGINLSGNTITGQVIVTANKANPDSVLVPADATIQIGGNQIRGSLSCTGNAPPPTNNGLANTVSGVRTGQCAAL